MSHAECQIISIHKDQNSQDNRDTRQQRQLGNLTYETIVEVGQYTNVSDMRQEDFCAHKQNQEDAKRETNSYSLHC